MKAMAAPMDRNIDGQSCVMLQMMDDKPEENITVYGGQEHELHEPSGILRQAVGVNKDPHAKLGEFCDLKEAGFACSGLHQWESWHRLSTATAVRQCSCL